MGGQIIKSVPEIDGLKRTQKLAVKGEEVEEEDKEKGN